MDQQERDRLFSEAFRAQRGLVAATVRKTAWYATADEVEDIVQEVMIVAWREFDPGRSATFAPWLVTTARNCAFSHMRKSIGRASLMRRFADEFEGGIDEGPETTLEAAGRRAAVAVALDTLKPPIRAIVALHVEGKSAREIARILGIHRETVGTRLAQGLKRLRRLLVTHA